MHFEGDFSVVLSILAQSLIIQEVNCGSHLHCPELLEGHIMSLNGELDNCASSMLQVQSSRPFQEAD